MHRVVRTLLIVTALGLPPSADHRAGAAQASPALGTPQRCARYRGLPAGFPVQATAGMVYVPAGSFVPGSRHGYPEERGDARPVQVEGFYLDRTEVTNAQFARFVAETGYVTRAEQDGHAPVFRVPTRAEYELRPHAWWTRVQGASWRHPSGPGSDLTGRDNRPVVQLAHADALAYAHWLGRDLPSEREWEYAAKAGLHGASLDHEPRDARGRPSANFWQGDFPLQNSREDGFAEHAPVGCFADNALGLYDMLGNVWEWTSERYTASQRAEDRDESRDPARPAPASPGSCSSFDTGAQLVIKGGSFLCSATYCARYRVAARHRQEAAQPSMHLGFRTVRRAP